MKITGVKIHHTRFFERLVPVSQRTIPGILDASTEIDSGGYAHPWDRPGLGLEIDWAWVDAHTVGVEA